MEDFASKASHGGNRTIEKFLLLRVIITTLVIGAGIMIIQLTNENFPIRPLCVLLLLSVVLGGVHYFGFRSGLDQRKGLWSIMIADIFLGTAIVHYSGGVTSPFSLIYCFSIIAAAFLLEVHGGLGIALLASCGYIFYGVLQSKSIFVPPVSQNADAHSSDPWIVKLYLDVSIFFLVGTVSGFLAERMKLKGRQLETAKTELKQLKIDTDNILENMSSGVLVADSAGKILKLNPAAEEILGFERGEVRSKHLAEAFESAMPELLHELVLALKTEKGKSRHEILLKKSRDKPIPIGISISLLKNEGRIRGVIAVFQDLIEVREMQERIRKADRLAAIGELSAGIAHEIRNPLASISGSIEMLHNDLDLKGEHARLMALIMRESDRLNLIISDFLEFARMRQPTMRNVPIDKCLEDVLVLLEKNPMFGDKVKIEFERHIEGAWVRIDEEQIRQVLLNLCINACEAMDGIGALKIEIIVEDDDKLNISIQDEGSGIDEEAIDHLFEPFFTTKKGGTGLGLAIANKIIEAHDGRIVFRNREEGGAEFDIILPLKSIREGAKEYPPLGTVTCNS